MILHVCVHKQSKIYQAEMRGLSAGWGVSQSFNPCCAGLAPSNHESTEASQLECKKLARPHSLTSPDRAGLVVQMFGKVEVPKEAFTSILKINSDA